MSSNLSIHNGLILQFSQFVRDNRELFRDVYETKNFRRYPDVVEKWSNSWTPDQNGNIWRFYTLRESHIYAGFINLNMSFLDVYSLLYSYTNVPPTTATIPPTIQSATDATDATAATDATDATDATIQSATDATDATDATIQSAIDATELVRPILKRTDNGEDISSCCRRNRNRRRNRRNRRLNTQNQAQSYSPVPVKKQPLPQPHCQNPPQRHSPELPKKQPPLKEPTSKNKSAHSQSRRSFIRNRNKRNTHPLAPTPTPLTISIQFQQLLNLTFHNQQLNQVPKSFTNMTTKNVEILIEIEIEIEISIIEN